MARTLTEERKQLAWKMWRERGTSNNIKAISAATGVSRPKLVAFLDQRQREQDAWAKLQRLQEAKGRSTKVEKPYIPPSDEELTRRHSTVGVMMALNDARARREAAEKRPIHRRSQTEILIEIRNRVDEALMMQGWMITKKKGTPDES